MAVYGVGQADAQREDDYLTPVKTGCQGIVISQCREDSCYCVEFQSPDDCPSRLRPFGIWRTARSAISGDVTVWQYSRSGPFAQIGVKYKQKTTRANLLQDHQCVGYTSGSCFGHTDGP